ncbi:MAG: extracellular solute-binding protein [Lachnospiraceae bacterium]|nr:extracellular solute-binding protein [Lachnospiraceae bacterium]
MSFKYLKIYLTAIVLVFGLSACKRSDNDYKEAATEYAEVTFYSDVNFWKPPVWDTGEDTITGEISKNTGVKLDIQIPTQEADTRLKLLLLDDELPDIISIIDETTRQQLVSSGKVWEIDKFLEQYKPDSHLLTDFPEDIKQELIKRDGAWYVYPSHLNSEDTRDIWQPCSQFWEDVVAYNDNNAIIWNNQLLKELELKPEDLQTEKQVLSAFEKAKNAGMIPLLLDGKAYQDPSLKYLQATFGAEWVDEQGNYKDAILQPEAKNALKFINTAVKNGYIHTESLTFENTQVKEWVDSKNVLCFIGNIANTNVKKEEWTSTGAILSSAGSTPVWGKALRVSTGWMQTFISKDCKHPERIAKWLDYMTSDEGMMLWYFGHEGEDYTIDENGIVQRTKKGKEKKLNHSRTGMTAWWSFVNTAWERSKENGEEEQYGDLQIAYGKHPSVVQYDDGLLMFSTELFAAGSEEAAMEQEIAAWKESQILAAILADSEAKFEAEYEKLILGLKERGIETIDELKNKEYQKNCKEYGTKIEKVNK